MWSSYIGTYEKLAFLTNIWLNLENDTTNAYICYGTRTGIDTLSTEAFQCILLKVISAIGNLFRANI